jgi:regulator of cell morphogenesis and NO signaling
VEESQRVMVDVRQVVPRERHSRIFLAFEQLSEGGEMVLVTDHDPKPLLYQFQAERPGGYDWSVLEEGPEVWRVLIARHSTTDRKGHSASAYLGWDHDRLDALFVGYRGSLEAGRGEEARHFFSEFRTGLLRHIRMEEEVLFPAFEESTRLGPQGPTVVMRQEHREIQRLLSELARGLSNPKEEVEELERLNRELLHLLGEHNAKEEHVVYPLTDRHHPAADRDALIRKMQAV